MDCKSSVVSGSVISDYMATTSEESQASKETYVIEQTDKWLALRVHGGSRSWPRLPSCFHNTE